MTSMLINVLEVQPNLTNNVGIMIQWERGKKHAPALTLPGSTRQTNTQVSTFIPYSDVQDRQIKQTTHQVLVKHLTWEGYAQQWCQVCCYATKVYCKTSIMTMNQLGKTKTISNLICPKIAFHVGFKSSHVNAHVTRRHLSQVKRIHQHVSPVILIGTSLKATLLKAIISSGISSTSLLHVTFYQVILFILLFIVV